MERAAIRSYAPQARRDFLQAVTDRAAYFGLTAKSVEPMIEKGDGVLIAGRVFPAVVAQQRKALEARVRNDGFDATVEALAYTWFDRLVALRYMELHDYLENGTDGASYRVLSHPEGKPTPEILDRAEEVELPGVDRAEVIDLKLDGKEVELYRLLLIAQCNALHAAMPFLFEPIADETELVLPENLLHTDSLIRKLVAGIGEADWREEIEIIGWLYESYNQELYAEKIGKVVECEYIPVVTQKFTPKWVVQYLVQNTLGRMWLSTYPDSPLKGRLRYYIEPAEQTPLVQDQLRELTPTSLNPEEITLLEPACGSGHILVTAYDVFKSIYQERGYRLRDIPTLILQKNLVGLEIDKRAAQLAALALMMKARADDGRIFTKGVQPRVIAIRPTKDCRFGASAPQDIAETLNTPVLTEDLPPTGKLFEDNNELFTKQNMAVAGDIGLPEVAALLALFEMAHCTGSMIRIPPELAARLPAIEDRVRLVAAKADDMFTRDTAARFLLLIEQAKLLSRQYNCVVANPPYMGSKYYEPGLKGFVNKEYKDAKGDLYACFIQRNCDFTKTNGFLGMITIQNWMFLSTFEKARKPLFANQTTDTFVYNGRGVFGSDHGTCSFVFRNYSLPEYRGTYRRLFDKQGSVASNEELESRFHTAKQYTPKGGDFSSIPGSPVAFWLSDGIRDIYPQSTRLSDIAQPRQGMATSDNERFLRCWHEVACSRVGLKAASAHEAVASKRKWFPYNKGGEYRRWYGNNLWLVNWLENGAELRSFERSVLRNETFYFKEGITWTTTSMGYFGVRYTDCGFLFDVKGSSCFCDPQRLHILLGFFASKIAKCLLDATNPTSENQVGDIAELPVAISVFSVPRDGEIRSTVSDAIDLARCDWNSFETSWDFQTLPILLHKATTLQQAQEATDDCYLGRFSRMKQLEEENNRLFIDAYGLQDELSPEVSDEQITLYRPDRAEDVKRLLSYILGCAMGRYSLDRPGLVYAHGGNVGFDPDQYKTLPADDDGIVPLLDADWGFADDAVNRVVEFVGTAWPREHLEANLRFLADGLEPKQNEPARATIRRYLAAGFFKDHRRWYKGRPIYWLFSSGKERAFQALVYLHRYHDGTLARMRTEYVIPLQSKVAARIEQLDGDIAQASSTAHRRKLQKEQDDLKKQRTELLAFDEKLRHAADHRITLDLDDGVKVNYGKLADLLANVKDVCGTKEED